MKFRRAAAVGVAAHYVSGLQDSARHKYDTQGGNVALERWTDTTGSHSLEFIYDNGGAPYSVIYDGVTYYYILNQQGDVVRIVDSTGATKAEYTYDAWGNILNVSNATGCDIGTVNPLRYRGYYYDTELGMYYVQSRYYDPVVKRMICADDESMVAGATLSNNNLFAYCDNNPVNRADDNGDFWNIAAGAVIGAALSGAVTIATNIVEQKKWNDGLASSMISGAASGALASTGAGVLAQGLGNGAINAITSTVTQCYKTKDIKKIDKGTVAKSFVAGFISGVSGGSGMRAKNSSYQAARKNAQEVWTKVAKKQYRTTRSTLKAVVRADKRLRKTARKCTIQTTYKYVRGTIYSYVINKIKWRKAFRYLWSKK